MAEKPPIDSLPFEINGVEEGEESLELTYRNETGNSVTRRTYHHTGNSVRETDEEWMFNFRTGEWERVHQFTHEYELADDETTLVGDGSGWDGAGRAWKGWFKQRHFARLNIRYQYDSIPEPECESAARQPALA